MAKFKSNHTKQKSDVGGMAARVGIFGAIVGGLYMLFNMFTGNTEVPSVFEEEPSAYTAVEHFLPSAPSGSQVVHYQEYSLSYNNDFEQADWVAYILTKENLSKNWNKRNDNFRPDKAIEEGSATPDDYRRSGYDRGHLVPAADLAWSESAMDESFLMSNISPQSRNFNKGIWRELEELTRNWAKNFKRLYVVTGPILNEEPKAYIGDNEVAVPVAYFKVLLDVDEPEQKGIAFLLPNEISYEPLYKYALSIDELEEKTGINFFEDFMPQDLEDELEGNFNLDLWQFSKQKHDIRVEKWNES